MDVLWGWERFFEELESFLRDLNRQIGLANRLYSEYAVERLEVCIHSVSSLVDLLHSRSPSETSTGVVQLSVQLAEQGWVWACPTPFSRVLGIRAGYLHSSPTITHELCHPP